MKPTQEQILQWAREAGYMPDRIKFDVYQYMPIVTLAYEAGRKDENEAWARVNMNDHKEGDLGIGVTPYAAQAAMVDQQTQGRMYVDPVTGDVGIGNPNQVTLDTSGATGFKLDASAPLVVHPHPAFQAPPPQREWQTLTENEIKHLWYEACQTNLELTSQLIVHLARNIEAKLKEKNNG